MKKQRCEPKPKSFRLLQILFYLFIFSFVQGQPCQFTTLPWYGGELYCNEFEPWNLVFSDEFDTDSLNKDFWVTYYPYTEDGSDNCEFCRTHGTEGQVYIDQNAETRDGMLHLIAKREETEWMGNTRPFSSGMIHSRLRYRFGKFEIRCKLPQSPGLWPAFWLFNEDELDVFEVCTHATDELNSNLHMTCDGQAYQDPKSHQTVDLSSDFHTVGVEWNPKYVEWYLDGVGIRRVYRFQTFSGQTISCGDDVAAGVLVNNNLIPDEFMNIIVNLAVISENGFYCEDFPPNSATASESEFIIDYVRVYQKEISPRKSQIEVYPNPTPGLIQFDLSSDILIGHAYILNDITGLQRQIDLNGSNRSIDLSGMASGRYHMEFRLNSGEIVRTRPFVIIEN